MGFTMNRRLQCRQNRRVCHAVGGRLNGKAVTTCGDYVYGDRQETAKKLSAFHLFHLRHGLLFLLLFSLRQSETHLIARAGLEPLTRLHFFIF